MKLKRVLRGVAYWLLGVGPYIISKLVMLILGMGLVEPVLVLTVPRASAAIFSDPLLTLLFITEWACEVLIATKVRYGKLSITNVLIILAIYLIPLLPYLLIPYYIGKGLSLIHI